MRVFVLLLVAALALACGPKSKHDILGKAEKIETKAELESALGAPDELQKLGPIETWTYVASDGRVTFLIADGKVTLQATGE